MGLHDNNAVEGREFEGIINVSSKSGRFQDLSALSLQHRVFEVAD